MVVCVWQSVRELERAASAYVLCTCRCVGEEQLRDIVAVNNSKCNTLLLHL